MEDGDIMGEIIWFLFSCELVKLTINSSHR